jgi:thiosulfate dehydrogenase
MHTDFLKTIRLALGAIALLLFCLIGLATLMFLPHWQASIPSVTTVMNSSTWVPPDSTRIPDSPAGELIRYGRELVAHTSVYLGPEGKIASLSNGMNCQNCHLKAGKKIWGNNYSAVASTYPKFRARSGQVEGVEKRVNDCIQRSLNGQPISEQSREMQAFVAYIKWVGSEVATGVIPEGAGIADLTLMGRAADPRRGESVYSTQCSRCHGSNGEGTRKAPNEWLYPPLWGEGSFNTGAGIFRLSRMAGFIRKNMPYDAPGTASKLSDEDVWDLAAFICSQPRPQMDLSRDWPDKRKKPFDHPFGPYADGFPEEQHKFGPFQPILAAAEKN